MVFTPSAEVFRVRLPPPTADRAGGIGRNDEFQFTPVRGRKAIRYDHVLVVWTELRDARLPQRPVWPRVAMFARIRPIRKITLRSHHHAAFPFAATRSNRQR
jgi:hypothetical protein